MSAKPPSAILIAGPTASGKSALALALAERLGGTVVNTDSMQVYRDLRIITARPTPDEEARVPHRLYGHVDAAEAYSAGRWRDDAAALLASRGAGEEAGPLIFVGGTGLYFEALTRGLSDIPPVPEPIREHWRRRGLEEAPAALHAELARRDPLTASRLRPSDPQRILRALEVFEATGRPLAAFQAGQGKGLLDPAATPGFVLVPEREALRQRIAARFHAMLEAGALAEVERLAARRLDPLLPAMKAHGVPWLLRHLAGEMTLAAAAEEGIADTRRYAKRQMTWFRRRMAGWTWTAPDAALETALAELGARGA